MRRAIALLIVPVTFAMGVLLGAGFGKTKAGFSDTTENSGNVFQAAANFGCSMTAPQTVTADADAFTYQTTPTTNYGTSTALIVQSRQSSQNIRSFIHFPLPAKSSNCVVLSATLRVNSSFAAAGREIQALAASDTWTEGGVTWDTQPGHTYRAAVAASGTGTIAWSVGFLVSEMYGGANNGFMLRDAVEDLADPGALQFYSSREGGTPPTLEITYGDLAGCSGTSVQTVITDRDAFVYQAIPTFNFGGIASLYILATPNPQVARTVVGFPLPAIPAGCSLNSATLRLNAPTAASGRLLRADMATASWTESGVTWNNQPSIGGPSAVAGSGTGWVQWGVKDQVISMYSGSNNGFSLRDSVEASPSNFLQEFYSREGSGPPQLVLNFGN